MNQVYKIGRDFNNNLVLDDKLVESFHAHLYINDNNELILLDLKSKYGSLVNGARANECALKHGDCVQIGFSEIDWLKIETELRATQHKITAVKQMPAKVFSEVETSYSGEASHKLAIDALQNEITHPVIQAINNKPELIKVQQIDKETVAPLVESVIEKSIETEVNNEILITESNDLVNTEIDKENNLPSDDSLKENGENEKVETVVKKEAIVNKKLSFDEKINSLNGGKLYFLFITMFLTMLLLGWVISIAT
jgi:pSer/pThr/pTyr-binding forkhead associated (FHA) protein